MPRGPLVSSDLKPVSAPGKWVWTEARRRAVEMVLEGVPDTKIAEKLNVTPRTIYNWRHVPEFAREVQGKLADYATRMKLRRVRETGIIADVLVKKGAEALEKDMPAIALPYLREFREFRNQERMDFGDDVRRVEMRVDGQVGVHHTVEVSALPFREFLEQNRDIVDAQVIPGAPPAKQLEAAVEKLMQSTDILDKINEEDLADEKVAEDAKMGSK